MTAAAFIAAIGPAALAAACRAERPAVVEAPTAARPTLAVLIAVDQLRGDLLDRYDTLFTGGFRRLRDRGFRFDRAEVDHAITVSHPGHVTLATGMAPARHGIVDAAFYEGPPGERRFVDALADPAERITGAPDLPGVSPRRILATTLPEWALAADAGARFAAVGSGQYSSLLHAGHARGDVYWYAAAAGRYVTSSWYRGDLPGWVTRFNETGLLPFIEQGIDWDVSVPAAQRSLANADDAPGETDGNHGVFPHRLADMLPPGRVAGPAQKAGWLASTPFLDAATLALARDAVTHLDLGRRGATDVLSIVLSQTDDVGHWYGPLSLEQMDTLLRIDRDLGGFFDFLDATVGRDRYVVALSADHGVTATADRRAAGRPARRVTAAEMAAAEAAVAAAVGSGAAAGDTPAGIAARVARALGGFDFIADAMTPADLLDAPSPDPFRALYRRSTRPDRVPRFPLFNPANGTSAAAAQGVTVRFVEGAVPDLDPGVHGTPYDDDRHVPIVFMGPGVQAGSSGAVARTVDVAPTLAALAGITCPADLDGRVLLPPRAD